jgi:hypothetical protein
MKQLHMPVSYVESIALKSHRLDTGGCRDPIGAQSAAQVSRHESGEREPDLRSTLAYRIVLDAPAAPLLPKLFREIAEEVEARAVHSAGQLATRDNGLHQTHCLELPRELTARISMFDLSQ